MSPRSKDSRNEVKNYAFKLLSYRSRSREEMLERLKKKGFDQDRITSTITFLQDTGFLQDEVVAKELFRNALDYKHVGRRGIELHLFQRGIPRELINESLSSLTREMEEEAARKLVQKKMRTLHNKPAKVVKQRLWGMLQRRGFSGDIIRKAIESIKELS
jgi:regulatory protein